MQRPQEPTIDAFEFARTAGLCEGEVELARLPRLADMLISTDGALRYRVRGQIDADGNPGAEMHLSATLLLTCQRCNQPLRFELEQVTPFRFVNDEQELNRVPIEQDDVDLVVGSRAMPVLPWVEDEAILSLPLVPRHADCASMMASQLPPDAERPHPFAVLAGLRQTPAEAAAADDGTTENDDGERR